MSRERSPKRTRDGARARGDVPVQGRPAGFPLGAAEEADELGRAENEGMPPVFLEGS
jgi:hypothetical protein